MKHPVHCFGEVLWDCLPRGLFAGGAPFNVAAHLARLGHDARMISAVGGDFLGEEILRRMERHGLDTTHVARAPDRPTGVVRVTLTEGQPAYNIVEGVAWDAISVPETLPAELAASAALVFGSLAARTAENRAALGRLLDVDGPLMVFDVNMRPPYDPKERIHALARRADWIKLNAGELARLTCAPVTPEAFEAPARRFLRQAGATALILTFGADGAAWVEEQGCWQVPGQRIDVVDTVGAGDAFLAACLHGALGAGPHVDRAAVLEAANARAARVASRDGAVPDDDGPDA
jgi:fructokinase